MGSFQGRLSATAAITDLVTLGHGWNGSIVQTAAVSATSAGGVITFYVERSGTGNLTAVFSDGFYEWDTTPAATVVLTAGTDTVPEINYVYLLQSTKVLTVSTNNWPTEEHAPLATVLCQSAASMQTDGPYKLHAWTDHITRSDDQGHISDLSFWIRQQQATYESGVLQTYTITTNAGSADNVIFENDIGVVLQLHEHTFPAFVGTPDIYVVNDSVTPYKKITDLNALLTDSTGASLSGRYFSLVIWAVISEDTGDCKLMINLPSGSYGNQNGVLRDRNKDANYFISSDFIGTGFLISEWKLRHETAASGTWTSIEESDLRGLKPSLAPGGGNSFPVEFEDDEFRIIDNIDHSKEIAFQAENISTATIRTITMSNADVNLLGWVEETTVTRALIVNQGVLGTNAATITMTLPATAAQFDRFRFMQNDVGSIKIGQNAGQTVHFENQSTTTGVGGSMESSAESDSIELICTRADLDFRVLSSIGIWNLI